MKTEKNWKQKSKKSEVGGKYGAVLVGVNVDATVRSVTATPPLAMTATSPRIVISEIL